MDQQLAMKWTYNNIAAFGGLYTFHSFQNCTTILVHFSWKIPRNFCGTNLFTEESSKKIQRKISKNSGNPNDITLEGESAGGASVSFHCLISSSWPYFTRAIIESAGPWNFRTKAVIRMLFKSFSIFFRQYIHIIWALYIANVSRNHRTNYHNCFCTCGFTASNLSLAAVPQSQFRERIHLHPLAFYNVVDLRKYWIVQQQVALSDSVLAQQAAAKGVPASLLNNMQFLQSADPSLIYAVSIILTYFFC